MKTRGRLQQIHYGGKRNHCTAVPNLYGGTRNHCTAVPNLYGRKRNHCTAVPKELSPCFTTRALLGYAVFLLVLCLPVFHRTGGRLHGDLFLLLAIPVS